MAKRAELSRREVLQLGTAALLSADAWPGALRAADKPSDQFQFFCVNDVHCMDNESARWLESQVLLKMKETAAAVDFCLILGDLAEKGTAQELTSVRDVFKTLKLPVHVVPGNHDYTADNSRKLYDEIFPKSLNYTFEHRGWQFIALGTTYGTASKDVVVQPDTLRWIDDTVPKLDRQKPTIVFTHFPLGQKVTYRLQNADDVLGRFLDHNLQAAFSGHYHARTERQHRDALLTTSPCCALKRNNHDKSPQKGYFLCKAKDGKVTREFIEVAVPA